MNLEDCQFTPDWSAVWTLEEVQWELDIHNSSSGFKFSGPGWYLSKTDVMLVIPYKSNNVSEDLFKQTWPDETKFEFHFYSNRNPGHLFGLIAHAPTRQDDR